MDAVKPVRVGIIGARGQGGFYASLVSDGQVPAMALGAMCGRSEAAGEQVRERFGVVPYFTDPVAMITSGEVEAVIVTTPHYDHAEHAIAALEAGLSVLVEKPLGAYTAQVARLLDAADTEAARTPGLVAGVMLNQRANPLFARLKQVLDSGEIGRVHRATWVITNWFRPQSYFDSSAWRGTWGGEGGGVVLNQAVHQLDLWQWLLGAPERVFAKVGFGAGHDIHVDDDVTATFDHGSFAGTFVTSTHDMLGSDRLEIHGDQGRIVVEGSSRATVTRLRAPMRELAASLPADEVQRIIRGTVDWSAYGTDEVFEGASEYGADHARVLENFARAVRFGEPLLAPLSEGANSVRLANAILLSAWRGEEVPFDFADDQYLAELNARIRAEGRFPERQDSGGR